MPRYVVIVYKQFLEHASDTLQQTRNEIWSTFLFLGSFPFQQLAGLLQALCAPCFVDYPAIIPQDLRALFHLELMRIAPPPKAAT